MELKFCTGTSFMFLDLPWKFESNRITRSSSKWRWSLKVIKWSLDDDRVILLDSNFQERSRNIKDVPVQNFSSIAAIIWTQEPIRLTCCQMISGAIYCFQAPFYLLSFPSALTCWVQIFILHKKKLCTNLEYKRLEIVKEANDSTVSSGSVILYQGKN